MDAEGRERIILGYAWVGLRHWLYGRQDADELGDFVLALVDSHRADCWDDPQGRLTPDQLIGEMRRMEQMLWLRLGCPPLIVQKADQLPHGG